MGRELRLQVIAIKSALHQEEHELHLQEQATAEKFCAGEDELAKHQEELRAQHEKQSDIQSKLKRADSFSRRFAEDSDQHCIFCFVERDVLSEMVKFEPTGLRILGIDYFRCEQCGRELKVEPPI